MNYILHQKGVGKSNILSRLTTNDFAVSNKSTIGVEFASRMIQCRSLNIKAQIWDTAGQEKYRAITSVYYRGAVGAIVVYDITDKQSFDDLHIWMKELKQFAVTEKIVIHMIGNKSDLTHERQVSFQEAKEFADEQNMKLFETSALNASNIENAFESIISGIITAYILVHMLSAYSLLSIFILRYFVFYL